MSNRKLFTSSPGPNQSRRPMPTASNRANPGKLAGVSNVKSAIQQMAPHLAPVLAPMVADMLPAHIAKGIPQAYRMYQGMSDAINNNNGGNNSKKANSNGNNPSASGVPVFTTAATKQSDSTMNASYGLSKAPNPKLVRLNSKIVSNVFANDYMVATKDLCAPMHLSCVSLQIPTSSTNSLYNYFVNTICFDIQTRAQTNVGFDLLASANFTAALLLKSFNASIYALQVYYWYSSILAYEADPRNKNEAMVSLRQGITSQQISDLDRLGKRLEDTPIPPNIVKWVKYFSSNYFSGMTQGSPLIKTCFHPDAFQSPSTPFCAQALAGLNDSTITATNALLRRSVPQWRVGKLYDVTVNPNFDRNFLTVFANLPYGYYDTTLRFGPYVATTSATISYNSYNNLLDGAAFACASVYDVNVWEPGLVIPVTKASAGQDSRYSWSIINAQTVGQWNPVTGNIFLILSRNETYANVTAGVNPQAVHLAGTDKAQLVSSNTLTQTASNVLDFLFNINSIPVRGQISGFNNIVQFK